MSALSGMVSHRGRRGLERCSVSAVCWAHSPFHILHFSSAYGSTAKWATTVLEFIMPRAGCIHFLQELRVIVQNLSPTLCCAYIPEKASKRPLASLRGLFVSGAKVIYPNVFVLWLGNNKDERQRGCLYEAVYPGMYWNTEDPLSGLNSSARTIWLKSWIWT